MEIRFARGYQFDMLIHSHTPSAALNKMTKSQNMLSVLALEGDILVFLIALWCDLSTLHSRWAACDISWFGWIRCTPWWESFETNKKLHFCPSLRSKEAFWFSW
jgi:hypothetical protein